MQSVQLGLNPDRHGVMCIGYENRKTELPDDFKFETNETHKTFPISIGPGAQIRGPGIEYQVFDIEEIRLRKAFGYIWGWVDYNDVFPGTERHRTEFCYQILVGPAGRHADPNQIIVTSYKKHNGSDEECLRKPEPYKA